MKIHELQQEAHGNAVSKGFYDFVPPTLDAINTRLMLTVGELAEAQEELRAGHAPTEVYYRDDGKPEGFGMELADAVIRIADLAGFLGINLEQCIVDKHNYNTGRPHLHGGKRF